MTHPPPYTIRQAGHAPALYVASPAVRNPAYNGDVTYVEGQHMEDGYTKLGNYLHPVSRDDKTQRESSLYMSIAN